MTALKKLMTIGVVAVFLGVFTAVEADSHKGWKGRWDSGRYDAKPKRPRQLQVPANAPEAWKSECGSCHLAFSPGLLPPPAWKAQMDTLADHYGSDASLDPATEQAIRVFLEQASTTNRLALEPSVQPGEPPRITTTRWYLRKHDKIRPDVYSRQEIGSAVNCSSCHGKSAEWGDFDDDNVSVPGGPWKKASWERASWEKRFF